MEIKIKLIIRIKLMVVNGGADECKYEWRASWG